MSDLQPRLYLFSPLLEAPEAFAGRLGEACHAGDVAAVLLRLAPADERTLVKTIKALAPVAQERGAAVLVEIAGELDAALVAARGGADGVHCAQPADLRGLRERLRDGRMLGAGQLRTKHDAMTAGEAGVDYVMFGEPRPDGYVPPLDQTAERAEWWAEIFEPPCVAYAEDLEAVRVLSRTGAEFVAIGDLVWAHPDGPGEAVRLAGRVLADAAEERAE
ncbi:thiamine phosphate synthase [Enterovirga sp. CN4-39]|uniref:thiamine phosphate synthase n=1 Tax=Enterovirga sp. CN4-39 TaxID=3400910 RepID=UPI003C067393